MNKAELLVRYTQLSEQTRQAVRAVVLAGGAFALSYLLAHSGDARAQELPQHTLPNSPTPELLFPATTPTPEPAVQAANSDQETIIGGKEWPKEWPNFVGKIEVSARNVTTGEELLYVGTGYGAVLPDGREVIMTCQHCLTIDDPNVQTVSIKFRDFQGNTVDLSHFITDHSDLVSNTDGRAVTHSLERSSVWYGELDFSVMRRIEETGAAYVYFVAYDPTSDRIEYVPGRLHKNTGDSGCIVPGDATSDHLCFVAENLERLDRGNSGGPFILRVAFDEDKTVRIVGMSRSSYLQYGHNEDWIRGVPSLPCVPVSDTDSHFCGTFPQALPTLTPAGTYVINFLTATATAPDHTPSPTHRPTMTATPRPTYTPTSTQVPQVLGHDLYVPTVRMSGGRVVPITAANEDEPAPLQP